MKTLVEVIKNFEICRKARLNLIRCDGCTYADEDNAQCIACNEVDVLLYLRGYKEDRNDLTALRAYWAEQQENNPLTWDELKQMEGKPVWVEDEDCYSRWEIINGVYDDGISFGDYFLNKNEFGTVWQAYRKERS